MTKKNKVERTTPPSIKTYYVATMSETVWERQRDRHTEQWNKTENPETDAHKYAEMIFDIYAKASQWKDSLSINGAGATGQP